MGAKKAEGICSLSQYGAVDRSGVRHLYLNPLFARVVGVRGESAGIMTDGIETRADVELCIRPVSTLHEKV